MSRRECLEAVAAALSSGQTFLATTHVRPDGDALGSLTALMLGLETLGKTVHAYTEDAPAAMYHFLPAIGRIGVGPPPPDLGSAVDAAIALDCASLDRAGALRKHLVAAPRLISVDHHSDSVPFGDVRCTDGDASSTAELMMELLVDIMGVGLTMELATCLLAGHVFDTGRFSQSNATPTAFRNAARLVEAGADPEAIVRDMHDTMPLHRLRLKGRALERAEIDETSGLTWSLLSRDDFASLSARPEDAEGIVVDLRVVAGSSAAALISEVKPRECRVSMRSRGDDVDVARLAMHFGGGGHTRAAGCTIEAPPDEAIRLLLQAAREHLAAGPE